jgi:hypothetical protein
MELRKLVKHVQGPGFIPRNPPKKMKRKKKRDRSEKLV